MSGLYVAAPSIFSLAGHPPAVRELEIIYFRILTLGSGFVLLAVSLSGFYSGRGLTRVLMFVHLAGALINIPRDYVLINGVRYGDKVLVPEMGIAGAAIATVFGGMFIAGILCVLVFRKKNEQCFAHPQRLAPAARTVRAFFQIRSAQRPAVLSGYSGCGLFFLYGRTIGRTGAGSNEYCFFHCIR